MFKYNATANEWQIGTDTTGTTINAIADIKRKQCPTNGQVLKWNQAASEWQPTDNAGTYKHRWFNRRYN